MAKDDTYEIENAKCIRATPKAILIQAKEFGEDTWIPQSQVDDGSEVYQEGDEGTLVVKLWWAEKQKWV
jgi:hypothetical protein